jgi:rhamnogalacturonyl hydrolase YesR
MGLGNCKWSVCIFWILVIVFQSVTGCKNSVEADNLARARQTLNSVFEHYDAGYQNLFNETYPYQEGNRVTYLADVDTLHGKRVAYLWPTSGLFSSVNALRHATGDTAYEAMLEEVILPGLENYFDENRMPASYQSYIVQAGKSDRFYDDNIWLALDFLDAYNLTGNEAFLQKSKLLWAFILSGWDDKAGGGIYWCEQKKRSKNTCSNAPAAVLGLKLYEVTKDSSYFSWGMQLYNWTQSNLQDPSDFLYFDNISIAGELDKRKFTYNTGQMLQAAALIYKITGDDSYLKAAEKMAESAAKYFTQDFTTPQGKNIRLFRSSDNWFNVIMFRGYTELYRLNDNPVYINIFRDNLEYLWNDVRDTNGLFSRGWIGKGNNEIKWLLDQAAMVEFFATMSQL